VGKGKTFRCSPNATNPLVGGSRQTWRRPTLGSRPEKLARSYTKLLRSSVGRSCAKGARGLTALFSDYGRSVRDYLGVLESRNHGYDLVNLRRRGSQRTGQAERLRKNRLLSTALRRKARKSLGCLASTVPTHRWVGPGRRDARRASIILDRKNTRPPNMRRPGFCGQRHDVRARSAAMIATDGKSWGRGEPVGGSCFRHRPQRKIPPPAAAWKPTSTRRKQGTTRYLPGAPDRVFRLASEGTQRCRSREARRGKRSSTWDGEPGVFRGPYRKEGTATVGRPLRGLQRIFGNARLAWEHTAERHVGTAPFAMAFPRVSSPTGRGCWAGPGRRRRSRKIDRWTTRKRLCTEFPGRGPANVLTTESPCWYKEP